MNLNNSERPEPNGQCSSSCGCKIVAEPTGREALAKMIAGIHVTRQQIQSFRDLLPGNIGGAADQGLRCLTKTCLADIEQDLQELAVIEADLGSLYMACPLKFNPDAERGFRLLVDSYQYRLLRRYL